MTSLKKKNTNENLKKAISFLGLRLTFDELGDKLGYTKGTVSKYLSEKNPLPPSDDFLNKFEEVFKVNLSDFENGLEKNTSPQGKRYSPEETEATKKENEYLKGVIAELLKALNK